MTTTAAAAAAPLLALIRQTETGHAGADAYRTIIGHQQGQLERPLTEMSVDQVLAAQLHWVKRWGMPSGAAGAYQIIRKTLLRLKRAMGLAGGEIFTPQLQDRLGLQLLEWRGLEAFLRGGKSRNAFGNELAKEWASFPVFTRIKGQARRTLEPGETYYAGDGINKALVSVPKVAKALQAAKAIWGGGPAAAAAPEPHDPALVRMVQQALWDRGYVMVGKIDGDYGRDTRTAIRAFEDEHGLPDTGTPSGALLEAILAARPRGVSETRAEATPAEVRAEVPEVKANWFAKISALVATAAGAVWSAAGWAIENLDQVRTTVQPALDVLGDVPPWAYGLVFAAGAFWVWQQSRKGEAAGVAAFKAGERR